MSDPARCWAPFLLRPVVELALVREFRYFCGAIGPQGGTLHWMLADSMKPEAMSRFLRQAGSTEPSGSPVIMVLDGASSHQAKALAIPDHLSLIHLPPYSPELNPVEILWHELREKHCSNRVFDTLDAVQAQVEQGLARLSTQREAVTRLSGWQWIVNSLFMEAT